VNVKSDTSTSISIKETVTISSLQDTQTINSVVASLSSNEKEEQLQIDQTSNKTSVINVSTEFAGAPLKITATRKGYKSITITLTTDLDGNAQLNSSRNLRGFTVVLSIGKVKLDTDVVRK
jgi:predicted PilT family ATPase